MRHAGRPEVWQPTYNARRSYGVESTPVGDQAGSGLLDGLRNLLDKGKSAVFGADPTGFDGEHHMRLKTPSGRFAKASFVGPGTNVIARLKRGDKPLTQSDRVGMKHDIAYGLAKTTEDIRRADNKLISKLNEIEANGGDSKFNTKVTRGIIRGKTMLENAKILDRSAFASNLKGESPYSPADIQLMQGRFNQLEQEGYGHIRRRKKRKKVREPLPGEALKMRLLKQTAKEYRGKGLELAGSGGCQDGKGLGLAGGRPNLSSGGCQNGGLNPMLLALGLPIAMKLMGGGKHSKKRQAGGFFPILPALIAAFAGLQGGGAKVKCCHANLKKGGSLGLAGGGQNGGFSPALLALGLPLLMSAMNGGKKQKGKGLLEDVVGAAVPLLSSFLGGSGGGLGLAGGLSKVRADKFIMRVVPEMFEGAGLKASDVPKELGMLVSKMVSKLDPKDGIKPLIKEASSLVVPLIASLGVRKQAIDLAGKPMAPAINQMLGSGTLTNLMAKKLPAIKKLLAPIFLEKLRKGLDSHFDNDMGGSGLFDKLTKGLLNIGRPAAQIAAAVAPDVLPLVLAQMASS